MKAKTSEAHDLLPNQKQKPQTTAKSGPAGKGFNSAGARRNGDNKWSVYPGQPTGNANYHGAVGDCK
jgi:hypothetical protein